MCHRPTFFILPQVAFGSLSVVSNFVRIWNAPVRRISK